MLTPELKGRPEPVKGVRPRYGVLATFVVVGFLSAACSTARGPVTLQAKPLDVADTSAVLPAAPPQVPGDTVAQLIAESTRLFQEGERELADGHLDTARLRFNRSLEVLLESPYGGRTEPRVREHFDRLVERISAYEVT